MNDGFRWEALCDAGGVDLETAILQDLESAPIYREFLRGEILTVDAETDLDLELLDLMYLEALLAVPVTEEFLPRHSWVH
jgi:hypothetical protein